MPGSSGGPIVDGEGRLLGINTNRLGYGFYLAIAAGDALRDAGRIARTRRGADRAGGWASGLAPCARRAAAAARRGPARASGLLVREVEEGSPAEQAGIAEGDLIVERRRPRDRLRGRPLRRSGHGEAERRIPS